MFLIDSINQNTNVGPHLGSSELPPPPQKKKKSNNSRFFYLFKISFYINFL